MSPELTSPDVQILLVAGPSGSGKSRLARIGGIPQLQLDEFYFADDQPGLPMTELPGGHRLIDWDDVGSWDRQAAVAALQHLVVHGRAEIPRYDISQNRATGCQTLDLAGAKVLLCEGIFAVDLLAPARAAGLQITPIWLDRPRWTNFVRRLARDLHQHRKPPAVLVRRGLVLARQERARRAKALDQGFEPMSMRRAITLVSAGTRS